MTFSIVVRAADGTGFGVAVASKFLGVGAVVPAAESGVGAVATQAMANVAYRPDGMRMLRESRSAEHTVAALTDADDGRADRQVGVVGRHGDGATYTGTSCHPWAGGVAGPGYAIQGNILVGPAVVADMAAAWRDGDQAADLPRRLLDALAAGDDAGGDLRGRQSAALIVVKAGGGYGGTSDVAVDLRVDDHSNPVAELGRLLDLHELYFGRPDPAELQPLEGQLAGEVRERLTRAGHTDANLDTALTSWAGIENLEERLVAGQIDPRVLARLRDTT